jgi:hypothetical protein
VDFHNIRDATSRGATPVDATQFFSGTVTDSFSSPTWQAIPGAKIRFVVPGRWGNIDIYSWFQVQARCIGPESSNCEFGLRLDGSAVNFAGTEEGMGDLLVWNEGSAMVRPGRHVIEFMVRPNPGVVIEVDGQWGIYVEQLRP